MSELTIAGWGNYPRVRCEVDHPESVGQLADAVGGNGASVIARGLGRSYGDPALNDRGRVLDVTGLDRLLAFDEQSGLLTCEAGVSLAQIIDRFTPRGFFPAITPGTKHVTVGGCIANDVHGKAHHVDGCFSRCVEHLDLLTADGAIRRVSRTEDAPLFWATVAGLGLTGVIVRAQIRLRRIETAYFRQTAVVVRDLDEMMDALERYDAMLPYSVAWIDPLATGKRLGRGVLTVGDHARRDELPRRLAHDPLAVRGPAAVTVPFELPNASLNPVTLRAVNRVLFEVLARGAEIAHYEKFFYPLDVIGEWNRGYGARGFTQYQFVIPFHDGRRRMRELLERIATSGQLPFLNVLKRFGPEGEAPLSFPMAGYTFAIDFPITRGLPALLRELDAMVEDAGGRIYLGKDAFLEPGSLAAMYPRLSAWREVKTRVDPETRFASHLSRRVGLTEP
ncbi:MAG: FAD-binding protein [Sandaracinaceae bacterium]